MPDNNKVWKNGRLEYSILENNLNETVSYSEYFSALGYKDKEQIYLRTFYDKGSNESTGSNKNVDLWLFDSIIPTLREENSNDRGVFYVVNGGGQKDKDVKQAKALFIDFDDFPFHEQIDKLNAFQIEPSIIVKTKKSLHAYWLLSDGNIDGFKELQKRLIQYFGSDKSIKNPSRVMRLYGFNHCKEEPVLVKLIKFSPDLIYGQREFHNVLPLLKNNSPKNTNTNGIQTTNGFKSLQHEKSVRYVHKFCSRHNIEILSKTTDEDGTVIAVECPWKNDHTDDTGMKQSAICIDAKGVIAYVCLHKHCIDDRTWKDFKAYYGEGPGDEAEPSIRTTTENGIVKPVKKLKPLKPISGAELQALDLPPINWIVNDILPEGVMVLSAPPKYFKSFMMLGLCIQVCRGGNFLNHECTKAHAVYFDLESTRRRPKRRLEQILINEDFPDELYFIVQDKDGENEVGRIGSGFEEQLQGLLDSDPEIKLVVIDVLKFVRPLQKRGQLAYDADYEAVSPLTKIASKYPGLCIVIITHDRKMRDMSDWTNNMSGSTGLSGAVDVIWRIDKESRDDENASLKITGRDIEGESLAIHFNKTGMQWECLGTSEEIQRQQLREDYDQSPVIQTIKKGLEINDGVYVGSVKDMIIASEYWRCAIYDTPQKVGKDIEKYAMQLRFDGITFEKKRKRGGTEYVFRYIMAECVTDSIDEIEF